MVLAFIFLVYSLLNLSPSSAVVKTGYSDIGSYEGGVIENIKTAGGYRDGGWIYMLTFPILAIVFGVMHNFIAVKLCKKRGEAAAKVFVVMSIVLVLIGILVLSRLLGER